MKLWFWVLAIVTLCAATVLGGAGVSLHDVLGFNAVGILFVVLYGFTRGGR
jgi:hypothetical protein